METVDPRIIEIALSRVDGTNFENFAQSFFSATLGSNYIPMGGLHDGGADGTFDDRVFEAAGTSKFMQASISAEPKAKIRYTIERLREVDRNPKILIYATSRKLKRIDQIEETLSDECDCRIVIRDGHYFQHQINGSPGTLQAYKSYVAGAASYLERLGGTGSIQITQDLPAKTLCVFIGQELNRRQGKGKLLEAITDSLILWALEETDPDTGKFLNLEEIEHRVIATLPSAKMFFKGVLKQRIRSLISKGDGGRKVNFHKKQNGYCLPYETRKKIREENIDDDSLQLEVSEIFRSRATQNIPDASDNTALIEQCVEVCHAVIHKLFYDQGLEVALFVEQEEGNDTNLLSISDLMYPAISKLGLSEKDATTVDQVSRSILYETYYNSTNEERTYLRKLCRTYVLLFMLKNEPRVVQYFQDMTANFNLYVGTDLIVRTLSEHMLPTEDQMTKNALKLLKAAGSCLILTDKTLDEVWHHIQITHFEFINNYQNLQDFMAPPLAKEIDHILIRAYFHTKLEKTFSGPGTLTWSRYLGQFLTVSEISKDSARDELREYLINEYHFTFEDEEHLMKELDKDQLDDLAAAIQENRNRTGRDEASEEILCRNAALMVLRIYQRRKAEGDRSGSNPYGFKTWWLTQQTKILDATADLVAKERSRYMMRPEFILHFLATVPSSKEIRESFDQIFPTMLGVKLGNRMEETTFKTIINNARAMCDGIDDSRARVILAKETAKLQSDFGKHYEDRSFISSS